MNKNRELRENDEIYYIRIRQGIGYITVHHMEPTLKANTWEM